MTLLRGSAIYLAALSSVLGCAVVTGAVRALATQGETGVFLLGLTAGVGLWAWGLFLLAAASMLVNVTARLDEIANHEGQDRQGGTK